MGQRKIKKCKARGEDNGQSPLASEVYSTLCRLHRVSRVLGAKALLNGVNMLHQVLAKRTGTDSLNGTTDRKGDAYS